MEHGSAVIRRAPRLALLLCLCVALLPAAARADRVVPIVNAASPVTMLDADDIKRLFLGIPVERGDVTLHAVLNNSDEQLKLVFLQYVVSMSDPAYQRRLLMLTLEQGRRMPTVITDNAQLLAAVGANTGAASYAWESAALRNQRVRILRELWHEQGSASPPPWRRWCSAGTPCCSISCIRAWARSCSAATKHCS